MNLKEIAIEQAVGTILIHNIVGTDGRKALAKGRVLAAPDIETLRALGKRTVYAAILDPGEVREDDAAARLGRAAAGESVETSKPSGGRVNWYATQPGFLRLNVETLKRLNDLEGVTLATIKNYSPVAPRKMIATVKTVGLALPEAILRNAEAMGSAVSVAPVKNRRVAIVLTGSENGRVKTQETFLPPIRARVQELGGEIVPEVYCAEDVDAIGAALAGVLGAGAQMVILAGETSVMDAQDVTPRGIRQAGGEIELYGAPVEPGNLLLLAYRGDIPILGAPGCVKSREPNVVDFILPRLLMGERVTRADVNALADGGLLVG
jgi:molybdenum cofactor cytidylyltransferase